MSNDNNTRVHSSTSLSYILTVIYMDWHRNQLSNDHVDSGNLILQTVTCCFLHKHIS